MNRILMMAALMALVAAHTAQAQNMIDGLYDSPAPAVNGGVMDMNPSYNPYTGPTESNRSQVSAAQAELKARGYRVTIDGTYGAQTRAAVKKFQRKKHLQVDGQLGPQTLSALGLSGS